MKTNASQTTVPILLHWLKGQFSSNWYFTFWRTLKSQMTYHLHLSIQGSNSESSPLPWFHVQNFSMLDKPLLCSVDMRLFPCCAFSQPIHLNGLQNVLDRGKSSASTICSKCTPLNLMILQYCAIWCNQTHCACNLPLIIHWHRMQFVRAACSPAMLEKCTERVFPTPCSGVNQP